MKPLLFLLSFFSLTLSAQTLYYNPLSFQRYQANNDDTPIALTHDSQGNIYFLDNTNLAYDISGLAKIVTAVVKCNANGDTLWSRYMNEVNTTSEYGTVLAVDHNDNVIVGGNLTVGTSSQQYAFSNFLTKFDPNGTILATDTFANGKAYNQLSSITVDAFNNVFAIAASGNSQVNMGLLLYKLNPGLQRQWVRTYANTAGKNDDPVAVLCNAQNEIYIAARTWATSSNQNMLVIKYDNGGNVMGTVNYDHLGLGKSEYMEGAVLSDTCIYLSGQYNQTGSNNRNFMLKLSQHMAVIKTQQFDAVPYNVFSTTNFTASDNVFALSTGYYNDSLAITLLDTALTIKYNKHFRGNSFVLQAGVQQHCGGLAFNTDKKICASLLLSDTVKIGATSYVKKYTRIVNIDSTGNVLYSKILNRYNQIRDSKVIWANNKNYIFGQGSWNGYGAIDIYLTALNDVNGNITSHTLFNCKEKSGSTDITLKQIRLANGNFVLANAHSGLYKFTTLDVLNPALQFQNSVLLRDSLDMNDSLMYLGKDAYDNIYSVICRRFYDTVTTAQYQTNIKVYKHNASLQLIWSKELRYKYQSFTLPQVVVSDSGHVFMSGLFSASNVNTCLLKINNAGVQQWIVPINTATATVMNNKGLVCNKENVVYLYGAYQVPSPAYQNFSILKFSANSGNLMLTSNYADSLTSNQDAISHALLLNDQLIVTGRYAPNSYQFTASIDTANLNIGWIKFLRYNNSSSGGKSLFTYQSDIFVIGYTLGSVLNGVYYMLFTKYDDSGNLLWTKNYNNHSSDWLITDRYACGAANGNTAVLATAEDVSANDNKNFRLLNYNYSTGNLINSVAWTYTPVPCAPYDDVPLNITKNGAADYLITGYASTFEYACTNPNIYFDTFYGSLSTSVVTEVKEEPVFQNDLKIYPNPGNTELNIQINNDLTDYSVSVFNILGENVLNALSATNVLKIHTTDFSNGIYFIKVRSGNTELTGKWVKSN